MEVLKAIETRRAYRSLEAVKIDPHLLNELQKAASLAPSCFNKQPWRMVFVTDPAVLEGLHGSLNHGNEWLTAASMIVAVYTSKELDCVIGEREYALFDTGMAAAFMILRATELGLVAHPIAGFNPEKAKAILCIPETMTLVTLIGVGKKSQEMSPLLNEQQQKSELERPLRNPLESWAFLNRNCEE